MASAEEAIKTALGITTDVLAWTNHTTTGQLQIVTDGESGVSSINTTVALINIHAGE